MVVTPSQHKSVLKHTSSFLLVPPYFHFTQDEGIRKHLWILGTVLSIASYLHWSRFSLNGWRRKLDIVCATSYLILEFQTTNQSLAVAVAVRFGSFCWFVNACMYPVGSLQGLVSHLMFRFLAWVAVMSVYLDKVMIALASLLFILYVLAILDPFRTFKFIEQCAFGKNLNTLHEFTRGK